MPTSIIYNANLTASTRTANILAGDQNEFVVDGGVVNVYAVSSAIGVKITVIADTEILIENKEIPFIGTTLDKQAHFLDSFEVEPGTRLIVFLNETAASATTDVYTGIEVL
jgi:hypothetical protein